MLDTKFRDLSSRCLLLLNFFSETTDLYILGISLLSFNQNFQFYQNTKEEITWLKIFAKKCGKMWKRQEKKAKSGGKRQIYHHNFFNQVIYPLQNTNFQSNILPHKIFDFLQKIASCIPTIYIHFPTSLTYSFINVEPVI